jgi:tetratricopeptide (TPR) repeat protein
MSAKSCFLFFCLALNVNGQNATPADPDLFDARTWGVVLEDKAMKSVVTRADVVFLKDDKATLTMDLYLPPGIKKGEKRPAIIFMIGIGTNQADQPKPKSWGIYRTWPQLMAARGFVGISMEADGNRPQESFQALFKFLDEQGASFNIDRDRLGVYAASANTNASAVYLMSDKAYKGIKAAVLYYGSAPPSPFRKDLPVLFVIAEGDVNRIGYSGLWTEVLKNRAPWTIKMCSGLPHAFDAFSDNDEARKVVKETISFWKNHLEPVEAPSWPFSLPREALAASYLHDDNKAANLSKQWLDTHPNDQSALRMYANSLKYASRYDEAEAAFRKLGVSKDNPFELMNFAHVLYGLGKSDEGATYVAMAEKAGNIPRFQYVILASILYTRKDYRGSAVNYEKALVLQPTGVDYYNLACTYALDNEKDRAFACLNRAIELGATSRQQYEGDTDLVSLHADPRWKVVVEKLR